MIIITSTLLLLLACYDVLKIDKVFINSAIICLSFQNNVRKIRIERQMFFIPLNVYQKQILYLLRVAVAG